MEYNTQWLSESQLRDFDADALKAFKERVQGRNLTFEHSTVGGRRWSVARNFIPSENTRPERQIAMLEKIAENTKKEMRDLSLDDLEEGDFAWADTVNRHGNGAHDALRAQALYPIVERDGKRVAFEKVTVKRVLRSALDALEEGRDTASFDAIMIRFVGPLDWRLTSPDEHEDGAVERIAVSATDLVRCMHEAPLQGLYSRAFQKNEVSDETMYENLQDWRNAIMDLLLIAPYLIADGLLQASVGWLSKPRARIYTQASLRAQVQAIRRLVRFLARDVHSDVL